MVYSEYPESLDRRESPRINWTDSEVRVVIIPSRTESKFLGWLQDISPGGFKVKAEIPQKVKGFFLKWEEIHFETSGDFFHLKGEGRIIWASSNESVVGIRFGRLDEESRKSLYGFLGMWSTD